MTRSGFQKSDPQNLAEMDPIPTAAFTPAPTEVPVVLSDVVLFCIGIGWILVCVGVFQLVRVCTRPPKGALGKRSKY